MVNPLLDQQAIIKTFLDFWQSNEGKDYNQSRYQAVSKVCAALNLNEAIATITKTEDMQPLIIATSARPHTHPHAIDFFSQSSIWSQNKPILLLFGTGQGLADEILEQADYLITPIQGLADYNHLSVRSAIAIALDRWLGYHERLNNS